MRLPITMMSLDGALKKRMFEMKKRKKRGKAQARRAVFGETERRVAEKERKETARGHALLLCAIATTPTRVA